MENNNELDELKAVLDKFHKLCILPKRPTHPKISFMYAGDEVHSWGMLTPDETSPYFKMGIRFLEAEFSNIPNIDFLQHWVKESSRDIDMEQIYTVIQPLKISCGICANKHEELLEEDVKAMTYTEYYQRLNSIYEEFINEDQQCFHFGDYPLLMPKYHLERNQYEQRLQQLFNICEDDSSSATLLAKYMVFISFEYWDYDLNQIQIYSKIFWDNVKTTHTSKFALIALILSEQYNNFEERRPNDRQLASLISDYLI